MAELKVLAQRTLKPLGGGGGNWEMGTIRSAWPGDPGCEVVSCVVMVVKNGFFMIMFMVNSMAYAWHIMANR